MTQMMHACTTQAPKLRPWIGLSVGLSSLADKHFKWLTDASFNQLILISTVEFVMAWKILAGLDKDGVCFKVYT